MAKTKQQKEEALAKIESRLRGGVSSVFVHFRGVNVADESKMRRAMREEGMGYLVAKKTLVRRALDSMNLSHKEVPLEGELAIAYADKGMDDATAPARRVFSFGKELGGDKLTIVGGVFDGRVLSASEMQEIATIPPVNTLRGMFVNVINSPIAGLAVALHAIAQKREA